MFLVALSLAPCLAIIFYRHPLWLLCLFPVSNVVSVFFQRDALSAGGFMLLPMDGVYFFTIVHLGLCALLQPKKMVRALRENKLLSIFLGVVAVYVVLWAPVYGFQRSLGEARKVYFMFLIPLLASVAIRNTEDLRKFVLVLVWTATSVAMFGLARVAMTGSVVLALGGEATVILAFVAFLMLVHRIYRIVIISPIIDRLLVSLFSLLVMLSGQRSVWLAVGFGLILMFWLYRSRSVVVARMLMISAFAVFGLSAGVSIYPELGSRLLDRFEGIVNPSADDTASWRIKRWQYQRDRLLKDHKTLWFGEGFGRYERDPLTGKIAPSAHNGYIQTTLKLGLFGLLLYALLAFQFFRKALAVRKNLPPGSLKAYVETGVLTFAAAHAYVLGYDFMPIMLIYFAVGRSATQLSQVVVRDARYRPLEHLPSLRISHRRSYLSRRPNPRPVTF